MMLKSDFVDYYDHCLATGEPVFERMTTGGPSKREQLKLLDAAGFLTPPHGLVGEVMDSWWEAEQRRVRAVVAYTDETLHCGEGKRVYLRHHLRSNPHMGMPGGDRYWRENELYCTAFVGCPLEAGYGASSVRRLQVGRHVFWVEYRSTESWMSNVGDGDCFVIGAEFGAGYHPHIDLPLFAVDFVLGREMYAVDFNTAPGIRGSGVEKLLPAPAAADAILSWFSDKRRA